MRVTEAVGVSGSHGYVCRRGSENWSQSEMGRGVIGVPTGQQEDLVC